MSENEREIKSILIKHGGKTKEVDLQSLRRPHHVLPIRRMNNNTSPTVSENSLLQTGNHRPSVEINNQDTNSSSSTTSNESQEN